MTVLELILGHVWRGMGGWIFFGNDVEFVTEQATVAEFTVTSSEEVGAGHLRGIELRERLAWRSSRAVRCSARSCSSLFYKMETEAGVISNCNVV